VSTKALIKRLDALEHSKDRATDYLREMVEERSGERLPVNATTFESLAVLIEAMPN
jgi:hypothetical protein